MIRVGFSTCRKNLISRIIRWFSKSQTSHAWLLLEGSFLGMDMVLQATEGGFQLTPYETFKSGNDVVCLIEPVCPLDEGVRKAADWLGGNYDYFGLIGSAVVLIGRWFKRKWKNPLNAPHAMFCSEAVVYVLQAANYPGAAALDPSATTPQDLMDFLAPPSLGLPKAPNLK